MLNIQCGKLNNENKKYLNEWIQNLNEKYFTVNQITFKQMLGQIVIFLSMCFALKLKTNTIKPKKSLIKYTLNGNTFK